MNPQQRIHRQFRASISNLEVAMTDLAEPIERAAGALTHSLVNGGKILICGNGGSAADAQHFSSELLNRFEAERPGLPAIAITTDASTLTSIANDQDFADIFARQVQALGQPGDVLCVITTSGNSSNVVRALDAARRENMTCVVLNGRDGGQAAGMLAARDVNLVAPGDSTARIQEVHGLVIHVLCDLIDRELFGHDL